MKKFIQSVSIEDYEVLTDKGWVNIEYLHKTIPYDVWVIKTSNCILECADDHILFNDKFDEIFVKDMEIGDLIQTNSGIEEIIDIYKTDKTENMYDLELDDDSDKRYFTNNILSHNTSFIKYLTKLIEKKEILFIPPSVAESLSEPSIIPFLMDYRNSILIIEDAETVITDRENGGSISGVSNILNITDGIMGDCLNIQIIATFNMEKRKIDKALLRKGRLIAEHRFENLSVEDSNNLLKHLKKDYITTEPMCLADIYNINEELIKPEDKKNKIGFHR